MKLWRKVLAVALASSLAFSLPVDCMRSAYAADPTDPSQTSQTSQEPADCDEPTSGEADTIPADSDEVPAPEAEVPADDGQAADDGGSTARRGPLRAPIWQPAPAEQNLPDTRAVGLRIDLFNYYVDEGSGNNNTATNSGINVYWNQWGQRIQRPFRFYAYGEAGNSINGYTGGDNNDRAWPNQGILRNTLGDDGYPVIAYGVGNGAGDSLSYLFDPNEGANGKQSYSNVAGLFKLDRSTSMYWYNSNQNYAYYDTNQGNNGNFTLHTDTYNKANSNVYRIGFFPFNRWTQGSNDSVTPGNKDHHFGMRLTGSFIQPAGGQVKGNDMVFRFSGDDDAWLFVDGVLVLDIGGIHQPAQGTVNFATGEISVGGDPHLNRPAGYQSVAGSQSYIMGTSDTLVNIFTRAKGSAWVNENMHMNEAGNWVFNDYSAHEISFFYLERGSNDSNLEISMNLSFSKATDLAVEKTWSDGNQNHASDSIAVQLYESVMSNGSYGAPVAIRNPFVLSAANNWKQTFEKLPVTDDDGNEIHYYVREGRIENGSFVASDELAASNGNDYALTSVAYNYQGGNKNGQRDVYDAATSQWESHFFTNGDASPSQGLALLVNSLRPKADLVVRKVDSADSSALEGATFQLYRAQETSQQGEWTLGEKIAETVTGTDGLASFTQLSNGIYALVESSAPTGYAIGDNDRWYVTVSDGQIQSFKDSQGNDVATANGAYQIENAKLKTTLSVLKVEKDASPQKALSNAKFRLFADRDLTTPASDEVATGSDGLATFDDLVAGVYWLSETAAPTGYQLLSSPVRVEITQDGTQALFFEGESQVSVAIDQTTRSVRVTIEDEPNPLIPMSGGFGGTGSPLTGISLLVLSCLIYLMYEELEHKRG